MKVLQMRANSVLCNVIIFLFCCCTVFAEPLSPYTSATSENETVVDSITLPEVEINSTRYQASPFLLQQQTSVVSPLMMEERQVNAPKDIASFVPNLIMPDYGSAMTSSIYIRGLGSRIDQPVVGMIIDGVPLLDKNMYDHQLFDIRRIEFLRGPQGTMYGRNTQGGIMEIHTLQPLDLQSTAVNVFAEYGSRNTVKAGASVYQPVNDKWGWGLTAQYGRTDGFFRNSYTDLLTDKGQNASGKFALDFRPNSHWRVQNSLSASYVSQGAFPYASLSTGTIAYNAEGSYSRTTLMESLRAEYSNSGYRLNLSASYQMLADDMRMDNDYSPAPVFTLEQKQLLHAGSIDALLKAPRPVEWYDWTAGISGFAKLNDMSAPVIFERGGIDDLILYNANKGIRSVFTNDSLEITEQLLPINSDFSFLNAGIAAFHQSRFTFNDWIITLGLRLDYETTSMRYNSYADLHYRFTLVMDEPQPMQTSMKGTRQSRYFNALPRIGISYNRPTYTIYTYVAEGYKAGGYNPQIFSTIMQNRMMNDLCNRLHVHLPIADERFTNADITSYKPERAWTAELGTHLKPADGLNINADVFYIYCHDMQVTVFPNGKTTGRMMTNAGRSQIYGAEADMTYRWQSGQWHGLLQAAYGFTEARFIEFYDGIQDYGGKHRPYAPAHTAHLTCQAAYNVNKNWLQTVSFSLNADGIGQIWWNEQNSRQEQFYGLLGCNIRLAWKWFDLRLWGKNLTNTDYNVFYFKSMEKEYVQKGKPRQLGLTLTFKY